MLDTRHDGIADRADPPFLEVSGLSVTFPLRGKPFRALEDISFTLGETEALGLVGESGSGKTTIGRALLQLLPGGDKPIQGRMTFRGEDLRTMGQSRRQAFRAQAQMVFQDPVSSFNPRRRITDIVAEGLRIQGLPRAEIRERVDTALAEVGLSRVLVEGRRPHQFSGGQCQRIAVARALALRPALLVCDEPVASLDVSVQARVLNLMRDMRRSRRLAMIFISHDLAVVRNIADRVAVLYMGRIVEVGTVDQLYDAPAHPYTQTLLDAVPVPDASRPVVPSTIRAARSSRLDADAGCAFRARCPRARAFCAQVRPDFGKSDGGRMVACHFPMTPGEGGIRT